MPPPPPPDKAPQLTDERDKLLLKMQMHLIKFYLKHDISKANCDVLCIALQFWWDEGLDELNKVFLEKYDDIIDLKEDIMTTYDKKFEDITIVHLMDVPDLAAQKGHLIAKYMIKANGADFFNGNSEANVKKYEAGQLEPYANDLPTENFLTPFDEFPDTTKGKPKAVQGYSYKPKKSEDASYQAKGKRQTDKSDLLDDDSVEKKERSEAKSSKKGGRGSKRRGRSKRKNRSRRKDTV
eukprot:snap_masked-scaffold_1-processed-gene-26.45-mRNA-1 protein AED:1.00 eAED:1.00 QI:0/-1/0/0/-1/1/1/0/237